MQGISAVRRWQLAIFMVFVVAFSVGILVPELLCAAPVGAAGTLALGLKLWGEPALQRAFRPVQSTDQRQSA